MVKEPPASGPMSPGPRALRSAELEIVLRRLNARGAVPPPVPPSPPEPEIEPVVIDLLAGATSDEPISSPPRAIDLARTVRWRSRRRRPPSS